MFATRNKVKTSSAFKMEKGSIFENGYGTIPKKVMIEDRLTIEAKGIYAYLCSFAGSGNEAFPTVSRMLADLKISKDRFYSHMNLLVEFGYIVKHQTIDEENKFRKNIYELVFTLKE
jgi:hypothetical protein